MPKTDNGEFLEYKKKVLFARMVTELVIVHILQFSVLGCVLDGTPSALWTGTATSMLACNGIFYLSSFFVLF